MNSIRSQYAKSLFRELLYFYALIMRKSDRVWGLPNQLPWHRAMKWANAIGKNDPERLSQCMVARSLQFLKSAVKQSAIKQGVLMVRILTALCGIRMQANHWDRGTLFPYVSSTSYAPDTFLSLLIHLISTRTLYGRYLGGG